jgi:hypothetical protein
VGAAFSRRKGELDQSCECCREAGIGELVADPTPFGCRGYQTAATQTGEMVRDVGLGETELLGQLRWIPGTVQQPDEELPAGLVRERGADASESIEVDRGCEHARWYSIG